MKFIGITGGVGAGKSAILDFIREHYRAKVVLADDLAKELMEQAQNNVLYLMDEPTVGLHPLDVEHFLALLNGMVEGGATVIAVEHNQQVIAASDWVVELGPGGGVDGGRAVFSGTPQELAACTESATGRFLEGW